MNDLNESIFKRLEKLSLKPYSRRNFFSHVSKSIVAAGIAGSAWGCKTQQSPASQSSQININSCPKAVIDEKGIKLSPLDAPTEKEKGPIPDPLPPEKRIGFAVVGLGHLALNQIIPALNKCKKSKLVALVSGDHKKAEKVAEQYGIDKKNIYNYENYDKLSENPDVQAIYIVLPNGMHAEFTIRGAKAGKHILCEKPMANSTKECLDMINACKLADKKLMIAYRIQYEPFNKEIKKMARDKKFGTIKLIEATNGQNIGDPNQWRLNKKLAGGGALPDVGIYCLNTIRYITGEEPIEVFATQYSTPNDPRFKEVEESVSFQLRFPSGIIANCLTGYGIHESRRYRVFAEKGWFGLDPAFPYSGLKMQRSHAEGKMELFESPEIGEKDHFALEIDHLSECIIENKIPYTPGEEGLQDQKIIEAIYLSAKTGKPVKLNLVEKVDSYRGSEPSEG